MFFRSRNNRKVERSQERVPISVDLESYANGAGGRLIAAWGSHLEVELWFPRAGRSQLILNRGSSLSRRTEGINDKTCLSMWMHPVSRGRQRYGIAAVQFCKHRSFHCRATRIGLSNETTALEVHRRKPFPLGDGSSEFGGAGLNVPGETGLRGNGCGTNGPESLRSEGFAECLKRCKP